MNRGNLPGYYWDEEKRKYFKIQANHLVSSTAKYSKGNVRQEKRLAKQREMEERKRSRRQKQTITPAWVLKSGSIESISFLREQGLHLRPCQILTHSESSFVSQWVPERVKITTPSLLQDSRVQIAQYVPTMEQMIITMTDGYTGASVLHISEWNWEDVSDRGFVALPSRPVLAFNSDISSVSTGYIGERHVILACSEAYQANNVFIGLLPALDEHVNEPATAGAFLTIGPGERGLHGSAICPDSNAAALIREGGGIRILDTQAISITTRLSQPHWLDWPGCAPCINWLSPNTVVYGEKHHGYSVMLWDTRTQDGRTPRFTVRERLTGVFNPPQAGDANQSNPHEILASTNSRIDLFDTRMPRRGKQDAAVLSFPHVHGGPRLQGAGKGSLFAAVSRDVVVEVYSTRTGTKVSSLKAPAWQPRKFESPILKRLMWYDDAQRGPTLQAVRGNGIVRWRWNDIVDDEQDEM